MILKGGVMMVDKKSERKTKLQKLILWSVFLFLCVLSLFIGSDENLTIGQLVQKDGLAWKTFLLSRVPRTAAIVITASGLSISGSIIQAMGRNRFISPSIIGTTDAAGLGILIACLFLKVPSRNIQIIFAFIFSMTSTLFFMYFLQSIALKETYFVPLLGIMYGGIITALSQGIAYQNNALQTLSSLNLGSFNRFTSFQLLWTLILPLILAWRYATRFSIVSLGEDFSKNLGVNYKRTLLMGIMIVSIVVAASYVSVGPIPFVGLIIPNLVHQYFGSHLKKRMLDLVLFGASFVLVADILSRVLIYPYEIAIGLTLGILGGVVFIIMIFRRAHQ